MDDPRTRWKRPGVWSAVASTAALLAAATLNPPVDADVLIDQGPDGLYDRLSFWHHSGGFQCGDDFQPQRPTLVTSVTFWLAATFPRVPYNWSFAVHRSTDEHPTRGFGPQYDWFHFQSDPTIVTDLGVWKGRDGTHLFEVTWDEVNLLLDPADTVEGTFWFSPGGWSNDISNMRSWWLTSGEGVVNGNEAWGKFYPEYHPPGWRPLSADGRRPPSDYAMRIEGYAVPAPGAFALISAALAPLRTGRRRTA